MAERPDLKDGLWHPLKSTTEARIQVLAMPANREWHHQTHRSYVARVIRWNGKKWVYDKCRHIHRRPSHGTACGERLARWLNKHPEQWKEQ